MRSVLKQHHLHKPCCSHSFYDTSDNSAASLSFLLNSVTHSNEKNKYYFVLLTFQCFFPITVM